MKNALYELIDGIVEDLWVLDVVSGHEQIAVAAQACWVEQAFFHGEHFHRFVQQERELRRNGWTTPPSLRIKRRA